MLIYKNNFHSAKTFYGITFQPGDIKEVTGYINDPNFIRVSALPKEPPRRRQENKTTSNKPASFKKGADKLTDNEEVNV